MTKRRLLIRYFIQWFIPVFLCTTLFIGFIVFREYKYKLNLIKQTEKNLINVQLKIISKSFEDVFSDIRYLQSQQLLKTFIDGSSPESKKVLENEYVKFAESKKKYLQLRIIDNNGWEQIRINYKNNVAKIIPKNELQNKKRREYFTDMITLNPTEIYVSKFDLNIEYGEIEVPYVPVVRVVVPIFMDNKEKIGSLVLNYLGDLVLQDIIKESSVSIGLPIFINMDGGYLLTYIKTKEWDFINNDKTACNFQKDYPEIWSHIQQNEIGQIMDSSGLFTYARAYPFYRDDVLFDNSEIDNNVNIENKYKYYWSIISYIPAATIDLILKHLIISFLPAYIVILLLAIFLVRSFAITNYNKKFLQMEQEKRFLLISGIIDTIPTPIFLKNFQKEYILCNDAFTRLVGRKKQDIIGKRTHDLFDENFTNSFLSFDDQAMQEKQIRIETKIPYADGKEHDVILYKSPILYLEDNNLGIVASITDITNIKENERKLIESEKSLKLLNATKDRFFSIIAHDLRNPLNVVHGFSGLLSNNYGSYNDEKRLTLINNISDHSKVISEMLENLLNWARSQSETIDINKEDIDLALLVNRTTSFLQTSAKAKNININNEIKTEMLAFADPDMIETVIRNIISNSIKFTKSGGQITVSEYSAGKGYAGIVIKDTGVGIKEDMVEKLFYVDRKFKTSGTNNELGTGLGLLLCKEFIEKNNGEIWVESTLGEGSSFYFTLPQ